jgi:hypothetical protein
VSFTAKVQSNPKFALATVEIGGATIAASGHTIDEAIFNLGVSYGTRVEIDNLPLPPDVRIERKENEG